jgi:L-rhamnose-H+ transport protein
VLSGICIVRVGFTLTGAVLPALGVSLGVTIPMIFKGSGIFKQSPGIGSPAGMVVLCGVAIMLAGVVLVAFAGFGRDKLLTKLGQRSAGRLQNPIDFATGLTMAALAGVLSCGVTFSFVYSQGPIVAAMKHGGASEFAANYSVWAIGLLGGALINVLYPAYLMTKHKTWRVLRQDRADLGLTLFMGAEGLLCFPMMGLGMRVLGALGASVGFGIQQAMQMTGSQLVGFISGEWKGVIGRPRVQMYIAIACLLIAATILAYGNALAHA